MGVGVKREGAEGEEMKEERMIDERTSGSFETPRGYCHYNKISFFYYVLLYSKKRKMMNEGERKKNTQNIKKRQNMTKSLKKLRE